MSTHADHHYSITVHTTDLAILNCLRALADHSQETGNTRIVWGGTGKQDWEENDHQVTFHFSNPSYRSKFKKEAKRVLIENAWEVVEEQDNNPARRQS